MVDSTLGSSAGRNPTSGSIRLEASSSSEPKDWVKALARSLQPLVRIASWIWSWVCFQASTRSEASSGRLRPPPGRGPPSTSAWSTGSREARPGSPRSLGPSPASAGRRCRPVARRTVVWQVPDRGGHPICRGGRWPNPSGGVEQVVGEAVDGAEQFAVDVELALVPGTVADPNGCRVSPALQVRQLPLGQIPFAADAKHDLQVPPRSSEPAAEVVT